MGVALLILNICATCASILVSLSPTKSIIRIHKQHDTGIVSCVPLFALLAANYLWTVYGFLKNDIFPVVVTNAAGAFTASVFLTVYYRWCSPRTTFYKVGAVSMAIMAIVTIYGVVGKMGVIPQSLDSVTGVVGVISICSSIVLYSSPLETVVTVVKTHDSSSIPVALNVMGLCSNSLWLTYAYIVDDMFLLLPSAINAAMSFIQVVLYIVFDPRRKAGTMGPSIEIPTSFQLIQTTEPTTIQQCCTDSASSSALSVPEDSSELTAIKIEGSDNDHYIELRSPAAAVCSLEITTCA